MAKQKQELLVRRKETVTSLTRAREMGDLSENGLYKAAKFELGQIDGRIRHVNRLIQDGKVVQNPQKGIVDVGSNVVLVNEDGEQKYEIVGSFESDPMEGKLSHISPLGKVLIGKTVGDIVEFESPRGDTKYRIENVS